MKNLPIAPLAPLPVKTRYSKKNPIVRRHKRAMGKRHIARLSSFLINIPTTWTQRRSWYRSFPIPAQELERSIAKRATMNTAELILSTEHGHGNYEKKRGNPDLENAFLYTSCEVLAFRSRRLAEFTNDENREKANREASGYKPHARR